MVGLSEQQHLRLAAARRILSAWCPSRSVPETLVTSLSELHGGLPSAVYCISQRGRGDDARGVTARVRVDRLLDTPFMRTDQLFSRTFAVVHEEESVWGAENRPVMGEELRGDPHRWRTFHGMLMSKLGFRDNLRIIFATEDAWLGWCGSFTTGSRDFTESDRELLTVFAEDMREMLLAWHELAPAFGAQHSMLQVGASWSAPVFAYTSAGQFLFANDAAKLELARPPDWLHEALPDGARAGDGWDRVPVPYGRGTVVQFFLRGDGPELDRFDAAVIARCNLPPHLRQIALYVMRGCSNKEIARLLNKSYGTVKRYVEKLRTLTGGARTRAEFVYLATRSRFSPLDPWPLKFSRARPGHDGR